MVQLSLAPEEVSLLRELLEDYLSDLRMEIADTDQQDFRERLKQEEVTIKKILKMLS
jgi:hypothetical protein